MLKLPRRRRVYLMRHGEAAYVSPDGVVTTDPNNVPLTATGRAQARVQGALLKDIPIQRAICSKFPRTQETIELVLAEMDAHRINAVETLDDLHEIQGLKGESSWPPIDDDRMLEALADMANPWKRGAEPNGRFLGGELFSEFAARVTTQWQRILDDDTWEAALLVLHGAVNRMILNHALNLPWSGDFCIEQDNCCLNIIDIDSTTPARHLVRAVNVTAYNLAKDGIHLTNMEATAMRVAETFQN